MITPKVFFQKFRKYMPSNDHRNKQPPDVISISNLCLPKYQHHSPQHISFFQTSLWASNSNPLSSIPSISYLLNHSFVFSCLYAHTIVVASSTYLKLLSYFVNAWCNVSRFSWDACTDCLPTLEVELHEEHIFEKWNHRQVFWKASVTWVSLLPNNFIITFMCMCLTWC
jgi:hypothetical protein